MQVTALQNKVKNFKRCKKLKGTNIFINNVFSKETMELRKEKMEEVKKLRASGKIAYLNYTTVVWKEKDQGNE